MDQIDSKVFALIATGTVFVVGLLKKLFPTFMDKKEAVVAAILPVLFVVTAKLLHAFHATSWIDGLMFAVGSGVGAGVGYDYLLKPALQMFSKSAPADAPAEAPQAGRQKVGGSIRKLAVGTALTLVLFMSSCTCGLTRQNVANVDTSFGKLKVDYLDMCKRAGLSAAQIDDRQKFVDSAQHDIDALKAAVK